MSFPRKNFKRDCPNSGSNLGNVMLAPDTVGDKQGTFRLSVTDFRGVSLFTLTLPESARERVEGNLRAQGYKEE